MSGDETTKINAIIKDTLNSFKDVSPTKKIIQKYSKKAILNGCNFMKHVDQHGLDLTNTFAPDELMAFVSVARHFSDHKNYIHSVFKKHESYNFDIVEREILTQDELNQEPVKCKDLIRITDKCIDDLGNEDECHKGSLVSPLFYKDKDTILTENTGFRDIRYNKDGAIVVAKSPPNYNDLAKFAERDWGYFTFEDTGGTYKYIKSKKHWVPWTEIGINSFIEKYLIPGPNNSQVSEFRGKIKRTNIRNSEEVYDMSAGYLNLKNCVINIKTNETFSHSKDWGFMYCLPYEYDPEAKAPLFEKFLDDITCSRTPLKQILLEFLAYGLSNDPLWVHKALFLYGEAGQNGKSSFLKIAQGLCGKENYSTVSISSLNDPQNVAMLEGKLFNIKAESGKALYDCEEFKQVTAGDSLNAKVVYRKPYMVNPRAKFMVACNHLPKSFDTSGGFFRRMLLVPFDAEFKENDKNTVSEIDQVILKNEAPGVLNMIIEAYKRLHKQGRFTESQESKDLLNEYMHDNIPELQFFEETYVMEADKVGYVTTNEMYERFGKWSAENNYNVTKISKRKTFIKILESKVYGLKGRKVRKSFGMVYEGIREVHANLNVSTQPNIWGKS